MESALSVRFVSERGFLKLLCFLYPVLIGLEICGRKIHLQVDQGIGPRVFSTTVFNLLNYPFISLPSVVSHLLTCSFFIT